MAVLLYVVFEKFVKQKTMRKKRTKVK